MGVTSLLELIEHLLTDGDAAADFKSDPHHFLSDHGLGDLSGHDVFDALSLGFDSVHPDLAQRIVLPDDPTEHHTAADAFDHLLDAASHEPALDDAHDLDLGHGLDFGLGHDFGSHDTFGAGHGDSGHGDLAHLALDLGDHLDPGGDFDGGDDTDTNTFDQGFGNGAHDIDVDHLGDVDDLHQVDPHHDPHHAHDLDHGPHGLV
jgi:hypothetical protein